MRMRTFFPRVLPVNDVIEEAPAQETPEVQADKEAVVTANEKGFEDDIDRSGEVQPGVQDIEAITTVWTYKHLVAAYIMIWIIYFMDALQSSVFYSMTPYVTSSFSEHSLTAYVSIMASLIGGLTNLPLAKILDIFGRPQGFLLMVITLIIGLVMMAACKNINTYAAAQVFWTVGYQGIGYCCSVFIADTSKLKNRALMYAYATSPYVITVWISGPFSTAFINGPGFRLGFGLFAIIQPFICLPLYFLFMWNYRKAKQLGLIPERNNERTALQSFKFYFIEFDVLGIFLLGAGLALFLLPFSLYSFQPKGWKSPMVISMIVIGVLLMIGFVIYEKYFAPKTFMPFNLLVDRTVLGANLLGLPLYACFYIWDSYFFSFLQVVMDLDITPATYVTSIYSIGSCSFAILAGLSIRYTGRFKWLAVYFAVPFTILGVGLMIVFRKPDTNIGYIIMCQIFIAFAGGSIVLCQEIAGMAATSHQYIAVILAMQGMFANIGAAIGSTVAAAIWTGVFPAKLAQYLPAESQGNLTEIYGSLEIQRSYLVGTPTRDAINHAYGEAQKLMLITSTALLSLSVVAVLSWRDINISNMKQVKGRVV